MTSKNTVNSTQTHYACVPDIAFRAGKKYACQPMGVYTNLAACVARIEELHSSFGYAIYPVDPTVCKGLAVEYGMCRRTNQEGLEIIGPVIYSFNVGV